jgi:hypothetical protein
MLVTLGAAPLLENYTLKKNILKKCQISVAEEDL